jgi:hypothetical protein
VTSLNEKLFILFINGESLNLQIVSPTNSVEISKLKNLNRKGLTKLLVIDTSYSYIFHQNNMQKLINNLSTKDNSVNELIDCTPDNHGLVQIYAKNIWYRKLALSEQEYESRIKEEKVTQPTVEHKGHKFYRILNFIRKQGVALL